MANEKIEVLCNSIRSSEHLKAESGKQLIVLHSEENLLSRMTEEQNVSNYEASIFITKQDY